jgi:hypothetical protein
MAQLARGYITASELSYFNFRSESEQRRLRDKTYG